MKKVIFGLMMIATVALSSVACASVDGGKKEAIKKECLFSSTTIDALSFSETNILIVCPVDFGVTEKESGVFSFKSFETKNDFISPPEINFVFESNVFKRMKIPECVFLKKEVPFNKIRGIPKSN